jgi:hypothetical protein
MVDKKVIEIKEKKKKEILRKQNVVGVGVGYKVCDNIPTDKESVTVFVKKKMPSIHLYKKDRIPGEIQGVSTDVIEVGDIVAQQIDPKKKYRPAPGGVSIGHFAITSGTLGCVVKQNGKRYILSNNHVLANSNNARLGDFIFQPGPHDGGLLSDRIATLHQFIPIDFGGDVPPPSPPPEPPPEKDKSWCPLARAFEKIGNFVARMTGSSYSVKLEKQSEPNFVDCALALPDEDSLVTDDITTIGNINGIEPIPYLSMPVKKFGRTTSFTEDVIQHLHVSVNVGYGPGKVALFEDQILTGPMSAGGDSGSIVVNDENKVVGLLFAGSELVTIINPIQYVIDALGIEF